MTNMRDGLSVVALLVSAGALVVALAGLAFWGPSEPEEVPTEMLEQATRRLDKVEQRRLSLREEIVRLEAQVTRAIELGSPGAGAEIDKTDIENRVRMAVGVEMSRRLADEAKKAGAPAPALTAPQKFDGMLAALEKALKLDANRMHALRARLTSLRRELNTIRGKATGAERERRYGLARRRADTDLRRVLGPDEFRKLVTWRRTKAGSSVKRFFGLGAVR